MTEVEKDPEARVFGPKPSRVYCDVCGKRMVYMHTKYFGGEERMPIGIKYWCKHCQKEFWHWAKRVDKDGKETIVDDTYGVEGNGNEE